jgi:hypothetical protein
VTSIDRLHHEAMDLVDRAVLARGSGRPGDYFKLIKIAFAREAKAAAMAVHDRVDEPSRSVLLRSAASLGIEADQPREAEQLIAVALAGSPPDEVADELRDLLETVNFRRHLSLRGLQLHTDEFQFFISGKAVGFGIVETDAFVERVKDVETLLYRTAERKLDRPFREKGARKQSLQKEIEVYLSTPRAASFAVSFKVGSNPQFSLPLTGFAEVLIDELLDCFELLNSAEIATLHKRITEEPYYRNFVALASRIAPDGTDIKAVGFTTQRFTNNKEVLLTIPRAELRRFAELTPKPSRPKLRVLRGQLRLADSTTSDSRIALIDLHKKRHTVHVPEGLMTDIVKPLWDEEVIVTARETEHGLTLQGIHQADKDDPAS